MDVAFEDPRWLWLLGVCLPFVWGVAIAWSTAPSSRRWPFALVRSLWLTGLAVAAARPMRVTHDQAVSAVVLFDVSASISDADLEHERSLLQDLRAKARPPHEMRVIRFAAIATAPATAMDTATALPAATSAANTHDQGAADLSADVTLIRAREPEALGTNIADALGLAAGLADPERTRRILLVSDGRATAGDAPAQAAGLARSGIRLDYVHLGNRTTTAPDVAITGLFAPADLHPQAAFPLRIDFLTQHPARIELRVTRNGRPVDPRQLVRTLSIPAGESSATWDCRVDDDETAVSVFAAEARLIGGRDNHPENDRALLAIAKPPRPHALVVVDPSSIDAVPLVAALRAQSVDVQTLQAATGQPFDAAFTATALSRVDMVALVDLPHSALGETAVAAIDRYVHGGGGLLVTGGPHAFGPGDWGGSQLESLLPVRLDVPDRQDEPSLALALIIDRSGSMSGAKMDLTKQAARATAEILPADDQIAVVAFDSQATTIVPMQRAANRLRITTNIGRIQPTGGTNILAGLREGIEQLSAARAKKKHAILLSDGQSSTDGIAELVDAAAASRITVSTIGVGDGVDDGLLQRIAQQGGGRYYHTRDPASIPRIFTRETSEVTTSGIVERPTVATPRKLAAALSGINWKDAPRLRGYVRTRPRPQADVLLAGDGGDPLLAHWPVGLGHVTAWTSDLGQHWADEWTRWPAFAQMWGQVARATMRPHATKEFSLTARAHDDVVDVGWEAANSDETFLGGMDGVLEISEVGANGTVVSSGTPRRVPLLETAPGQYDAHFQVAASGAIGTGARPAALLLRGHLAHDGVSVAEAVGQVSIAVAPEYHPAIVSSSASPPTGGALLEAMASATGGGALKEPSDLFRGGARRERRQPLRSVVLVVVTLIFVSDVALRQLMGARGRVLAR